MKSLFFSLLLVVAVATGTVSAQNYVPQGFIYQAVARDPQGITLPNQSLVVRIGIISGTPNGPLQYQENHSPVTNGFGLFTVTAGQGVQSGGAVTFPNIDWSSGAHYMKVEVDFGSGYELMGITQIWSVPYALQAKRAHVADSLANGGSGIPPGVITMWSGNPNNIPAGWALCNGANGTPDLRGKFIVGYDPAVSDYNTVGNTGGSAVDNATHQVTIDPPSQTFTTTQSTAPRYGSLSSNSNGDTRYYTHTHDVNIDISSFTVTTGPPSSTENRPPYYTLAYIIKL